MEIQIVIFLAFTCVALIFNSIVIWLAYKAFANVTTALTESIREVESSKAVRSWFQALESASFHAVSVTSAAKQEVAAFEPVLARAQSEFGFKLAKLDVEIDRTFTKILSQTEKAQNSIVRPAECVGATLAGVQGVLGYLTEERNAADASSRPK